MRETHGFRQWQEIRKMREEGLGRTYRGKTVKMLADMKGFRKQTVEDGKSGEKGKNNNRLVYIEICDATRHTTTKEYFLKFEKTVGGFSGNEPFLVYMSQLGPTSIECK